MSDGSEIEWTDATWNPTRGCTKVSPGCKHCYAETFAERFRGVPGHPYEQGFDPRVVPDALSIPLHWRKPRTIFVNSMSDLFGEFVPDDYIAAVFGIMAATPRHTYQVLTKRAERLPAWFEWVDSRPAAPGHGLEARVHPFAVCARATEEHVKHTDLTAETNYVARRPVGGSLPWPLPNVHLGVSVEDRRFGLPRMEHLRRATGTLRFLSIEPLLEDLGTIDLRGIGWVIVGGESGPGARPLEVRWVRNIVVQCREQRVPVFVKQLGAKPTNDILIPGARLLLKSAKGKDPAEWPEDLRIREMPGRFSSTPTPTLPFPVDVAPGCAE